PARGAARLPVRQALAGRRPNAKRSRPWLVAGLSLIAGCVALLFLSTSEHQLLRGVGVILGPILSILGFGACSPWLLEWTTRRAARLPLAWRLAVRDAGRFRERNAAVVTAVLASMAMSVTMAALVASLEGTVDAFPATYRDDQLLFRGSGAAEAAARARDELDVVAAAPLLAAYLHGEPLRGRVDGAGVPRRLEWVAVGGPELLRALGAEAALDDFEAGRVVALDIDEDAEAFDFRTWVSNDAVAMPPVARVDTDRLLRDPVFVLSEAALEARGLERGPAPRGTLVPWLLRLSEPVTPATLERGSAIAADSVRTAVDAAALQTGRFRQVFFVVFLICALTGLVVVLTAVSLSAAESAADERILHTVGASPQLLRGHQAARAGFLALLGCLLALPAGLLAAAAFFSVVNFPLIFVTPWRDLAMIGFALPTLVYVGTWCFAGLRRTSTDPGARTAAARR
ncbi:MAG: FtsX-like permease family protein, partial [Acidobacteriota bacterium]